MIEICFFLIGVQSVSASSCMHLSGSVSYDCRNESSNHRLKYFIFTDLTCVVVVDVCHSWLCLMMEITSDLQNLQTWHIFITDTLCDCFDSLCGRFTPQVSALPFTGRSVTRGHFHPSPTRTRGPWPHKAACSPYNDSLCPVSRDLQPNSICRHSGPAEYFYTKMPLPLV